jgi:uncharacterized protein (TIGR03437 family)
VTVGGVPGLVKYAGAVPSTVAGLTQINVELGAGTPSGAQPVVAIIGSVSSQANVTAVIR